MEAAAKRPDVKAPGSRSKMIRRHWQLYLVILIPMALLILFSYIPMFGIVIAFQDFIATKGFLGSPWVGMKHFQNFVSTYQFKRLLTNTLGISLYQLVASFPIPIIFSIMLNECRKLRFKKAVQMVSYAPHFISTVVMVSIVMILMAPRSGLINNVIEAMGSARIDFLSQPQYFKSIYVWSGVWQSMGYNSVIYIAALAGIDPTLHEAAIVDGASKLQKIWHIDLPGIAPTIVILLILQFGQIMNIGYEKIFLLQNPANMSASDVISTYVYRVGLVNGQYSFSTAVNLFNSVINTILLVTVNQIARKVGDTSLW